MKKIKDTEIARELNLHQQSFARWKKDRPEVYAAIRGYYELKYEVEELRKSKVKLDKIMGILCEK